MKRFYDKVKVDVNTGCHEWTGGKTTQGYGNFRFNGRVSLAHRVSWTLRYGGITNGLHCLHKCDNPSCVNPEHLFLGTHQDNMADRDAKGRGKQLRGEAHCSATITREQAQDVVNKLSVVKRHSGGRVKNGELRRVADETGVSYLTVRSISGGQSWKHIIAEEV